MLERTGTKDYWEPKAGFDLDPKNIRKGSFIVNKVMLKRTANRGLYWWSLHRYTGKHNG